MPVLRDIPMSYTANMSNLPPGVTGKDIEYAQQNCCVQCGHHFDGDETEDVCPRCKAKEDQ